MRLPRRRQPAEVQIDIAERLAPHVAADIEPWAAAQDDRPTVELTAVPA